MTSFDFDVIGDTPKPASQKQPQQKPPADLKPAPAGKPDDGPREKAA